MAAISFFLLILAAISQLLNFIIAASYQRRIRDRLANWYVAVETGDWRTIPWFAARLCDAFWSSILGWRCYSLRALGVATLLALVALASLLSNSIRPQNGDVILFAAVVEAFVVAEARHSLRLWIVATPARSVWSIIADLFVIPATFGALLFLVAAWFLHGFDSSLQSALDAATRGYPTINLLGLLIVAVPGFGVFVVVIAVGQVLNQFRRLTRGPLGWILEHIESAPNGLFGTIALGLTTIAALLAGYEGLQGH